MAEILWDKKVGTYDRINSDYLTPEPHAHNIQIDLEIEVYLITYDWGNMGMIHGEVAEFTEPYYIGNLEGKITSANFSLDSTSDMRTTGSFSIILDENSKFITNASDSIFWQHVWFRVIKKYNYPNDINMYPMFNWGDHIGLWNNNGLYRSDPSQSIIGWFAPNSSSATFNADTKEFSISCTDLMAFYTDTRGGHLSNWWESLTSPKYSFYDSIDRESDNYGQFLEDKMDVATYSNGILIEGQKNNQLIDLQYNNYFSELISKNVASDDKDKVAEIWKKAYEEYRKKYIDLKPDEGNYKLSGRKPDFTDTASLIKNIVADYGHLIPIRQVWVTLQNDYEMIPYDMEFNGDTTLYDVFKKIIDLYPRQTVYFDSNRTLCFEQRALAWGEMSDNDTRFRAREFYDLVLEEQWNINLENIKNFTVVWGRDNTTYGYFYMTSYQAICSKCGRKYNFSMERLQATNPNKACSCGGTLKRLHITNETYSVQQIGTHKQVIYDDNVLTEEEAFNEAKWRTIASCRAAKTLTVTLVDRYLSMYQYSDKAIGKRIEYKSHLTNETDVYTLLKWTNNFTEGTVTLELEPYYTCVDEYIQFGGDGSNKYFCNALPVPIFDCSVDENGLMTMIINNGWQTAYSLFKVYYRPTDEPVGEYDYWHRAMGMDFLGETCEVYEEETEDKCQTKVFRHQFEKSGRYMITCQAWNPNIHPSGCNIIKVIEINLGTRYVSEDNKVYIDENNKEYIS